MFKFNSVVAPGLYEVGGGVWGGWGRAVDAMHLARGGARWKCHVTFGDASMTARDSQYRKELNMNLDRLLFCFVWCSVLFVCYA